MVVTIRVSEPGLNVRVHTKNSIYKDGDAFALTRMRG